MPQGWQIFFPLGKITGLDLSAGISLRRHRLESLCHQLFLEQLDKISVSKKILPEAPLLKL
jgi:hypothetical protein